VFAAKRSHQKNPRMRGLPAGIRWLL
jgi:hypothetical protein